MKICDYIHIFKGRRHMFKFLKNTFTCLMFLSFLTLNISTNAGELLVYSSTDADNLKHYMDEFQKDHPDI